jgi:DNA modification methylase
MAAMPDASVDAKFASGPSQRLCHKPSDGRVTASWRILEGDCRDVLRSLDAGSVQTCVTSPPYFGLRDYGHDGQIGLEPTPDEFVAALVGVFREVRRVLRDDGTVWLNLGDSYNNRARVRPSSHQPGLNSMIDSSWSSAAARAGCRVSLRGGDLKEKDLLGIPWMTAFALRADGWYLRSDIIWAKPSPMPESVTDRPTKAHEYLFLLSKGPRYFYDADAIREDGAGRLDFGRMTSPARLDQGAPWKGGEKAEADGRNKRSVWTVATQPYPGAHFATFPPKLIEPCILAGCPEGGTVLDPFGAGTTGMVALRHGRSFVGIELSADYVRLARDRIIADSPLLNTHAEAARAHPLGGQ